MALRTSIWKNRLTRRALFPDTCCPDCITAHAAHAKKSAKATKREAELDAMKQRIYADFHAYIIMPHTHPFFRVHLLWGGALSAARGYFERTGTPCTIYAINTTGDEMPVFDMPLDDDGEASYQTPPLGLPHARGMSGGMGKPPKGLRVNLRHKMAKSMRDGLPASFFDWNEYKKVNNVLACSFPRADKSPRHTSPQATPTNN